MSNLNQLERQWKQYKSKQRRPLIIGSTISIFIISMVTFFLLDNKSAQVVKIAPQTVPVATKNIQQKQTLIEEQKESNKTVLDQAIPKVTLAAQELRPSFTFMKQIKEEKYSSKKHNQKQKSYQKKQVTHKSVYKAPKRQKQQVSRNSVAVSAQSTHDKIDALAKRFNHNRNPLLGIAVAKQYLKSKKYKQAYFYALEVNNIDQTNEESWLISAQALYHLKNRDAALKLLRSYLKKHSSSRAQRLYNAIKRGKLK